MKIGLVIPKINVDEDILIPPLGILYIAAVLKQNNYEVKIFDQRLEGDVVTELIFDWQPDVLGVSVLTASFMNGIKIAENYKKQNRNSIIAFGGPHVSALPEETLIKHKTIDIIFINESEFTFLEYVKQINGDSKGELKSIANIAYRQDDKIIHTEKGGYLTSDELDSIPMPAFDLLDIERYFSASEKYGIFSKSNRVLPVMSSRGCPNSCTYCCRMMGFQIRNRDSMKFVDEIEYLINHYNLGQIDIVDDNFTINRKRAIEILTEIKRRDFKIAFKCANGMRADAVDEELLTLMKEVGYYTVGFGIESGSPDVLKLMKKNLKLDAVEKAVALAKKLGFLISGNWIMGIPGEKQADVEMSIRFFRKLNLDSSAIVNCIPFPGTTIRAIAEEKNYLTPFANDWNNYAFVINDPIVLMTTEDFSEQDIKRNIRRAYRKIYFRPTKIFKYLKTIRFSQIIRGFKILFNIGRKRKG